MRQQVFTIVRRQPVQMGGVWIAGNIGDERGWVYRFDALVFAEHATNPAFELGESRISKLWVQQMADQKEVFNFDRGADLEPQDEATREAVELLVEGLAQRVFGH